MARSAPQSRSFVVIAEGVTVFGLADGITYTFQSGSFGAAVNFIHNDMAPQQTPPLGPFQASTVFQSGGSAASLLKPVTIMVPYTDFQVWGLPLTTLGLYSWDSSHWNHEATGALNTSQHTLTSSPGHLGIFAVLAATRSTFLPLMVHP